MTETKTWTFAAARAALADIGHTITRRPEHEYRVNVVGGSEATAYYTTDLEDAVNTARFAVKRAEAGQRLVYKNTLKTVLVGDTVNVSGAYCTVAYCPPPHKPSSEGKVTLHVGGDPKAPVEYYVSIIGAEWINRTDRT